MNTENTPRITAQITGINDSINGAWFDTVTIYRGDEEIDTVLVEPSEDEVPYDQAVIAAGYPEFTWITSGAL
jgi:hypothetical protein